jgi:hypothetical protein
MVPRLTSASVTPSVAIIGGCRAPSSEPHPAGEHLCALYELGGICGAFRYVDSRSLVAPSSYTAPFAVYTAKAGIDKGSGELSIMRLGRSGRPVLMLEQREGVELPPDSARLWRYMDFTKFVGLLESQALFFSRADQFEDLFEGGLSRANIVAWPDTHAPGQLVRYVSDRTPLFTFVSCWNLNEHESAAMWRVYLSSREGVAITSTVGRLKAALAASTESIVIGKVRYIDYDSEAVALSGVLPFFHKRMSFEHEREVRALFQDIRLYEEEDGRTLHVNLEEPEHGPGVLVPTSLPALITSVVVAPTAAPWFRDLVASVVTRFGQAFPVLQSRLDDPRLR